MKTIGLLGGMSWESTAVYYRLINEGVKRRLGGLHSAKIALVSVDFHEIEVLQHRGEWDTMAEMLTNAALSVEEARAEFLVICTNTMHRVAPEIEAGIRIPILHIADATAEAIKRSGMKTVGLLGTRFTMEHFFLRGRLESSHDLSVLIPNEGDREIVHRVIYEELCKGEIRADSRDEFLRIIGEMAARGAEGVILGCTEIGSLVRAADTAVPLFDTTLIHANAAVEAALES